MAATMSALELLNYLACVLARLRTSRPTDLFHQACVDAIEGLPSGYCSEGDGPYTHARMFIAHDVLGL